MGMKKEILCPCKRVVLYILIRFICRKNRLDDELPGIQFYYHLSIDKFAVESYYSPY